MAKLVKQWRSRLPNGGWSEWWMGDSPGNGDRFEERTVPWETPYASMTTSPKSPDDDLRALVEENSHTLNLLEYSLSNLDMQQEIGGMTGWGREGSKQIRALREHILALLNERDALRERLAEAERERDEFGEDVVFVQIKCDTLEAALASQKARGDRLESENVRLKEQIGCPFDDAACPLDLDDPCPVCGMTGRFTDLERDLCISSREDRTARAQSERTP